MHRFTRIVALVLLTWTVADLSYFQCCLGDETRRHASTQIAATSAVGTAHSDTDDCFCCARCLDTGLRLEGFRHAPEWTDFQEPAAHLATRPAALDHPPQIA